jgi:hypothetical protein
MIITFIDRALWSGPVPRARTHPCGAHVSGLADVRGACGAAGQDAAVPLQLERAANGGGGEAKAGIRRSHVCHAEIQTYEGGEVRLCLVRSVDHMMAR